MDIEAKMIKKAIIYNLLKRKKQLKQDQSQLFSKNYGHFKSYLWISSFIAKLFLLTIFIFIFLWNFFILTLKYPPKIERKKKPKNKSCLGAWKMLEVKIELN